MAEKIIKKQKLKKIGNCKLMSERLVSFDVPTYINQLKDLFQKTELFFKKTYQGFYCSLCDAEMHQFFDVNNKTLIYSEKFCRDIIEHNLPTLLYQHRNFIKLGNLVSQLLAGCDFNGMFNVNGLPPKEVVFKLNQETIKTLMKCDSFANHKSWFSYCVDTCDFF